MMLLVLAVALQDDALLQWKYPKGDTLRYRMSQKVSTDANGTPVRQQIATTMAFAVKDVDAAGVVTIEVLYEAIAARASGIQEYDYDSEKDKEPPDDPAARMMAKLVGQSFTMKMGPDGNVLDVRGCEKVVEAMSKGLPEGAPREKAVQALRPLFSDEAFKSRMQQLVPPFPKGAVRKGGAWTNDFALKLPIVGGVTYAIRSTLADVRDGNAEIEQEIKVEFKGAEDKENPLGNQVQVHDARGKSSAVFSIAKGRYVTQKAALEMVLVAGKTRVPVRVETELKLLEKK